MSIIGGLTVDELIKPGSVRPELLRETLALVYASLMGTCAGAGSLLNSLIKLTPTGRLAWLSECQLRGGAMRSNRERDVP
jgi:hypothetical protein